MTRVLKPKVILKKVPAELTPSTHGNFSKDAERAFNLWILKVVGC